MLAAATLYTRSVYVRLLGWRSATWIDRCQPAGAPRSARRRLIGGVRVRGDGFGIFGDWARVRQVPGNLLRDLLAPWARQCGELGLDLSQVVDADLALALVRLVGRGRRAMPAGLVDALDRIEDLADDAGFDTILARVEGAGRGVDWGTRNLGPLTLAVRTWTAHHALFEEAEIKRDIARSGPVREYPALPGAELALPCPEEAAERLQAGLSAFWRGRGRGDYCRVAVFRDGGRIHVPIHRGRTWRTEPAVDGDEPTAVSFRPRAADLVTFDERTGRLMVKARTDAARREYVAQIGEALFGEAGAIVEGPVVSLQPLVERGRAALAPTPGLREVELVEAKLRLPGTPSAVVTIASPDVLDAIAEHALPELRRGTLFYVKLMLRLRRGRKRKLELAPPNWLAFDRRQHEHVVLGFLEERGFVAAPGGATGAPEPPPERTAQLGLWG